MQDDNRRCAATKMNCQSLHVITTDIPEMAVAPTQSSFVSRICARVWMLANHLAAYALLNLMDDPAILAIAFC
jgi:hypothetical protein